jgi:histidine triad (HIT) family protein
MKGCIFCKIIGGELPSTKVFENDKVLAFLDIHPVAPGHTLVIPKNEVSANIFDVSEEDWLACMRIVHLLAPAIEKATAADGVNLMMNNRTHAGQVVDHPHVHIIPRFKGDGLRMWEHSSYQSGEAERVAESIRAALR